jgi:6-phosphogluconolactonase
MTQLARIFILFGMLLSSTTQAQQELLYIGTYTPKGEGIYVYRFNREDFSFEQLQVVTNANSPTFLAFHPSKKVLYSANEAGGTIGAYNVDPASGHLSLIGTQPAQGNGPCHVAVDPKGRFIYVSNYGSGDLAVYHLKKDGSFGALADSIQNKGTGDQKPHMHSMIPSADGKFVYASDLGIDKILVYAVDGKTGKLKPAATPFAQLPAGAGPRHFVISENGKFAYSAAELNNTVTVYSVDQSTGGLTHLQTIPMLPEGFNEKSYAADIHFSPDGNFVYASNRGHESIVTYAVDKSSGKLSLVAHESSAGKHPRNFMVDAKGEYVLVANKNTDNIVVYTRDAKTGKLTNTGKQLNIGSPVCVLQVLK